MGYLTFSRELMFYNPVRCTFWMALYNLQILAVRCLRKISE